MNKRTVDSVQKGKALFERAVAEDPRFALGRAGIADAYILLAKIGAITGEEAAARAWPEVSAALALDDQLPDGYISRGTLLTDFEWNWPAAELDFQKALELNPNSAPGHHWYARHLAEVGRSAEALERIAAAEKQDPLSPIILVAKAKILFVSRAYEQSIAASLKALELEPDFKAALSILGQAYAHRGEYPKAIAAAQRYVELSGGSGWAKLELAYVYAVAGNKPEADAIVNTVNMQAGQFSPYDMATICSASHDLPGALAMAGKSDRTTIRGCDLDQG